MCVRGWIGRICFGGGSKVKPQFVRELEDFSFFTPTHTHRRGGGGESGASYKTYLLTSAFLKIELMEYDVRQLLLGARLV